MQGYIAGSPAMKSNRRVSTIENLPQDIIVRILAQVIADSPSPLSDLGNIRGTCNCFCRASTTRAVARSVPVGKELSLRWRNKERYLVMLKSCASAGNLEASFLLGLECVFGNGNVTFDDEGFSHLKDAANGGHDAARYALGILLFGHRDAELRQLGTNYLNGIGGSSNLSTSRYVEVCRREVTAAVRNISWMRKFDVAPRSACTHRTCGRTAPGNDWDFQRQEFCSQSCRWTDEHNKFFKNM